MAIFSSKYNIYGKCYEQPVNGYTYDSSFLSAKF